jgi:hypothetical protein
MAQIASSFSRDGNRVPIWTDGIITKRTITFAGATTNAWGNDGGTLDGAAIYTVTGLVFCKLIAACTTSLTGGTSTIEVGITGATAIFMPTETSTQIDSGQIWFNDAGNATYGIIGAESAAAGNLPEYALNGNDIILTVKTADTETGVLDFYCIWRPISSDGDVVATTT